MVKLLVARHHKGNLQLGRLLKKDGIQAFFVDTVKIVPIKDWRKVDDAISRILSFDWVLLTSPNGASFLIKRARKIRKLTLLKNANFAAVGPKTKKSLESQGIKVSFVPSKYTTECLGVELPVSKRVVAFRALNASRRLEDILEHRGFVVESIPIYSTIERKEKVSVKVPDGIIFGSPSEVRALVSIWDNFRYAIDKPCFCIGPVTEMEAKSAGFMRTIVPKVQTFDSLLEEVKKYFC